MKKRLFLYVQAALCVLLVLALCAQFIGLYREGAARREQGEPTASIYTREKVAERLTSLLPLGLLSLFMTVIGLALGIRDEAWDRPTLTKYQGRKARPVQAPARGKDESGIGNAALRRALLIAALILTVAGALNGSLRDVLYKAVNVCTECVGLG